MWMIGIAVVTNLPDLIAKFQKADAKSIMGIISIVALWAAPLFGRAASEASIKNVQSQVQSSDISSISDPNTLAAKDAVMADETTPKKTWNPIALLFQIVMAIFGAITAAEMENDTPGSGAAKKARAVQIINDILDPIVPDVVESVVHSIVAKLIDVAVSVLNKSGFFGGLGLTLNSGSSTP